MKASSDEVSTVNGTTAENIVNVLLNFEIQEVGSLSPLSKQKVQV